MINQNMIHIAIAPPDKLEIDLISKVAAIIRKDLYGTRLILAGKVPKLIAHYHTASEAESIARSLADLGIVAFTCEDIQIRKRPLKVFNAHKLNFNQRAVIFHDRNGEVVKLEEPDVFLIVKGKIQTYVETDNSTPKLKLSVGKTLLTGGIPIWNQVQEKTASKTLREELFLRFYDRSTAEPKVELTQQGVDYSFLGRKVAFSSLMNFENTACTIKEAFPHAIFDDKLMHLSTLGMSTTSYGNDIEVNCRLLYLYYLASKENSQH
jgi:hypothetical protein